jgi:hypothetical protein
LINRIEKIRAKHPRNSDLRKLIVLAAPLLIKQADNEIGEDRLESAEGKLSLAANWNVSASELSRRRKQIQQMRIDSFLKMANKQIQLGKAKLAEYQLNAALRLGADPTKIKKIRQELPLTLATVLIRSGKFEQAGEMLLEFELEGKYDAVLPGLYNLLHNKKNQFKWGEILDLIKQKQFSKAEQEIEGWKIGNPPANLPKLKKYLQQEKTEFTQHINKRRERVRTLIENNKFSDAQRELTRWDPTGEDINGLKELTAYYKNKKHFVERRPRVRSLIENNKFSEAKRELAQWEKTGEDQSELLKLTSFYKKRYIPFETVLDPRTGLMWQKKPDGVERNWQNAKGYCEGLLHGGYSDWKLPGGRELREVQKNKHILDPYKISGIRDSSYWTSDASSIYTNAFIVHFDTGDSYSIGKYYLFYVRCVRREN